MSEYIIDLARQREHGGRGSLDGHARALRAWEGGRMSATEELRRLLDERGVEWCNIRNDGSESDYLTEWQLDGNEGRVVATEWAVGNGLGVEIHRYHLTPEQAIAATLWHGTCHWDYPQNINGWAGHFVCSNCGHQFSDGVGDWVWEYCPNCGARVVDE